MDLQKIRQLVKTDCYGEKDEIINEAVLICLETSCDEEIAVKKAFKKFRNEFYDKKFNYVEPVLNEDNEDLRDNYLFEDKSNQETFKIVDEDLIDKGKELCKTACLIGQMLSISPRFAFASKKAYFQKNNSSFNLTKNLCDVFLRNASNPLININRKKTNYFVSKQFLKDYRRKNNEQTRRNERNVIQTNGTFEQDKLNRRTAKR